MLPVLNARSSLFLCRQSRVPKAKARPRYAELGDSSFVARRIAPDRRVLVASPDYLDRCGLPTTPDDLDAHACLVVGTLDLWTFAGSGGKDIAKRVTPMLRINDGGAVRDAARAALEIALMATWCAAEELRSGVLVPVLPNYPLVSTQTFWAIYPSARELAPKVRVSSTGWSIALDPHRIGTGSCRSELTSQVERRDGKHADAEQEKTMSDHKHSVAVPARLVPFPSSISPEARAGLARLLGEDGEPLHASYTMPSPEDYAGWMAIKAATDGQYATIVKQLAGTLRSSVETIRIGDATIHVATPETMLRADLAYLDFHGGALVFGGGTSTGQYPMAWITGCHPSIPIPQRWMTRWRPIAMSWSVIPRRAS
nr:substrate binding domain-containing protein [Novosphingobium sp. AP12]